MPNENGFLLKLLAALVTAAMVGGSGWVWKDHTHGDEQTVERVNTLEKQQAGMDVKLDTLQDDVTYIRGKLDAVLEKRSH